MDWFGSISICNVVTLLFISASFSPSTAGMTVLPRDPSVSGASVSIKSFEDRTSGLLHLSGQGFRKGMGVSVTPERMTEGSQCFAAGVNPDRWAKLSEKSLNETDVEYFIKIASADLLGDEWFTCVKSVLRTSDKEQLEGMWVHQGDKGRFWMVKNQPPQPLRTFRLVSQFICNSQI